MRRGSVVTFGDALPASDNCMITSTNSANISSLRFLSRWSRLTTSAATFDFVRHDERATARSGASQAP